MASPANPLDGSVRSTVSGRGRIVPAPDAERESAVIKKTILVEQQQKQRKFQEENLQGKIDQIEQKLIQAKERVSDAQKRDASEEQLHSLELQLKLQESKEKLEESLGRLREEWEECEVKLTDDDRQVLRGIQARVQVSKYKKEQDIANESLKKRRETAWKEYSHLPVKTSPRVVEEQVVSVPVEPKADPFTEWRIRKEREAKAKARLANALLHAEHEMLANIWESRTPRPTPSSTPNRSNSGRRCASVKRASKLMDKLNTLFSGKSACIFAKKPSSPTHKSPRSPRATLKYKSSSAPSTAARSQSAALHQMGKFHQEILFGERRRTSWELRRS